MLAWLVAALVVAALAFVRDVPTWLLLHLLLLGAVSNAILIWSSYLTASVLGLPPRLRAREQTARLVLLNAGAVIAVVGMTLVNSPELAWAVVIAGAAVIGEVAIWHGIELARRLRRAPHSPFGVTIRYYVVAAALLPIGLYIGILLVPDDLPESTHAQLALAHVCLNLLGWLGLTVLGTLVPLWPAMSGRPAGPGDARRAGLALPLLTLSVALLAGGAIAGARPITVLGVAGYLVGAAVVVSPALRRTRPPLTLTYATASVMAALVWWVGSVTVLGVILATAPGWEAAAEAADGLAVPLLVGFVAQALIGVLSFLIPVALGDEAEGAGRRVLERGAAARFALVNGGLVVGLMLPAGPARTVVAGLVLAALASFVPLAGAAIHSARRYPSSRSRQDATT